jgi:hypothetical protein
VQCSVYPRSISRCARRGKVSVSRLRETQQLSFSGEKDVEMEEERLSCLAGNRICRATDEGYNAVRRVLVLQDC